MLMPKTTAPVSVMKKEATAVPAMKANTSLRELAPAHPTRALVRRRPNVLLLHDGRHAEDAQYEPGGGRREAGKCIGQRGHHAQKDQKHDADESHDALRHGSAEPQRHRRQQHADGHDAFMGKTLESRHRAGGNHENCSQRRADHALDRERPLLEQLAGRDDATSWLPFGMASSPRGASDSKARTPAA